MIFLFAGLCFYFEGSHNLFADVCFVLKVAALIDILKYFGWSYISFLYSDDSYGRNAAALMETYAKKAGICMALSYRLSTADDATSIGQLVDHMMANRNARIIVLFAQTSLSTLFLAKLNSMNVTNQFLFLSGDYWSTSNFQQLISGM